MMSRSNPETDIQRAVLDWLRFKNIFAFRINNMGVPTRDASGEIRFRPSTVKGISDIFAVFHGRFVAIEVKTQTGKMTEYQQRFLDAVKDSGGVGLVIRSIKELEHEFLLLEERFNPRHLTINDYCVNDG